LPCRPLPLKTGNHDVIASFVSLRSIWIHHILHVLVEPLGHLILFLHSQPSSIDLGHVILILNHTHQSFAELVAATATAAVTDSFLGFKMLPRLPRVVTRVELLFEGFLLALLALAIAAAWSCFPAP